MAHRTFAEKGTLEALLRGGRKQETTQQPKTFNHEVIEQMPGKCRQCKEKTNVYPNRLCGKCWKPWDLSAAFCMGCATFYQLMGQNGKPSRNERLVFHSSETAADKCVFCRDTWMMRPPNTATTAALRKWIARQFRLHQETAKERNHSVAPGVVIIAVTMRGGLSKEHGPAWLGLAAGDLFRNRTDPVVVHGPQLIVPAWLAGGGNPNGSVIARG